MATEVQPKPVAVPAAAFDQFCHFQKKRYYATWATPVCIVLSTLLLLTLFQFGFQHRRSSQLQNEVSENLAEVSSSDFLLKLLAENGTQECQNVSTTGAQLFGLPKPRSGRQISLSAGKVHNIWIVSFANGTRRCYGGDFYETDLTGLSNNWKSRPLIYDLGDGSYQVQLYVDPAFAGRYSFKATLLFSNFHGLETVANASRNNLPFVIQREMIDVVIDFLNPPGYKPPKLELPTCTSSDLRIRKWPGRWTRKTFNSSCKEPDAAGRYKWCLPEDSTCEPDIRCTGNLANLESNGWVYSVSPLPCKFRIWSKSDAWDCLSGKKLFFWGDSNHQDTIYNLATLVLEAEMPRPSRTYFGNITNPANPEQTVRIVQVFNGHRNQSFNYGGLECLDDAGYRLFVEQSYLENGVLPYAVIANSGIHDGVGSASIQDFDKRARNASLFWKNLLRPATQKFIFRTTVAPAGPARKMAANPNKMEAYNTILSDHVRKHINGEVLRLVDAYDMSFPWHYDYCCSDGGHYGRRTNKQFYFVDLMLVHILLTAVCTD